MSIILWSDQMINLRILKIFICIFPFYLWPVTVHIYILQVGNSTPTGTQEKKIKSCKYMYIHPNIVSNVKICVDSKSAEKNTCI